MRICMVCFFILSFLVQSWGSLANNGKKNAQVTDFLETLEQFIASLSGAQENMMGQVYLADTEHARMLDNMKSPSDYNLAGT